MVVRERYNDIAAVYDSLLGLVGRQLGPVTDTEHERALLINNLAAVVGFRSSGALDVLHNHRYLERRRHNLRKSIALKLFNASELRLAEQVMNILALLLVELFLRESLLLFVGMVDGVGVAAWWRAESRRLLWSSLITFRLDAICLD